MAGVQKVLYKVGGVSKVYGRNYILNDVSFSINQGELFGIIGSSGSGKTAFLNLLVGFVKPDRGDIKIRDIYSDKVDVFHSVNKYQSQLKKIYGFASQSPSFYPNLTVIENLRYFGSLYNLSSKVIEANAQNLLTLVGLTQAQHTLGKKLSGGMKRRLDIVCSLIHDPQILILDEPTSDLDPVLSNKIWNLLRVINQAGTTVIIASHELSNLENVCHRIAIIKDGKIAAIGKPGEIKSANALNEEIHLKSAPGNYKDIISSIKQLDINLTRLIRNYVIKDQNLIISTRSPGEVTPQILKVIEGLGEHLTEIEFVKPSMDNLFEKISNETDVSRRKKSKRKQRKRYKNK